MRLFIPAVLLFFFSSAVYSQRIERIDPPNWWIGMNNPNVQLLIHGDHIAEYMLKINYPGVTVAKISKVENLNYLFVDITIDKNTKPGNLLLEFSNKKASFKEPYELKQRVKRNLPYGLDQSDFIYLLMPDRFSNGDAANDTIRGMHDNKIDRNGLSSRHGGDLQGMMNHLDYIHDLGVTAIWSTPLLENNQVEASYHGYAVTDHYKIDPRFGNNELYKKYVDACHAKGMKVIMDVVHNHCGNGIWFMNDLPEKTWIHQWDSFTRTNYRTTALLDPHASEYDKKLMSDGWFDIRMPDLNQKNPYLATYLIENNIWWIEYAGVDAFRLDTYTYSDLDFLIHWKQAIEKEYPGFGMFGEVWVQEMGVLAYFKGNNAIKTDYNSTLNGVTDFELYWSITNEVLNGKFGWTTGVSDMYRTLAQDYLYNDATHNVIFLGNHDLSRIYSVAEENLEKYKMGVVWLLTMRGIPEWYYGDEILMKNLSDPDGKVREDFPGGWAGDKKNKFDEANLSEKEKEAFDYVKKLANWRKTSAVIHTGKLMQYVPYDGVYVYFRYTDTGCVMVIMNTQKKEMIVPTKNYYERLRGYTGAKNIITDETTNTISSFTVPAMTCSVYELTR